MIEHRAMKNSGNPTQVITIVLGGLQELDGKMQLLNTLHILITAHGEIKLILLMNLDPCRLALVGLEGCLGK